MPGKNLPRRRGTTAGKRHANAQLAITSDVSGEIGESKNEMEVSVCQFLKLEGLEVKWVS